jgi:murein DD-endopeptidase MepM/ murein hydrolase activator NlpD
MAATAGSSGTARAQTRTHEPFVVPADWTGLVERGRLATAEMMSWISEAPELALTAGARLQLGLRDLAADSQALLAQLFPYAPTMPDLTPLIASPVPGVESSGFGWRRDPMNHRSKFHKGTDFRADRGTPVYAAGAGLVAFTGRQNGYGNVIYVDHGGGLVTRYAHLSRIETKAGAPILAGVQIGRVGATGRATGPHLHFEVRLDGRAVDPAMAMHVAELQRNDPDAARVAALELGADVRALRVDRHDPVRPLRTSHADGDKRPERRGAPARDRTLW